MANLMVGANEAFHTISDAVGASHGGDTIYVQAGTYVNDFMAIDHDLNIIGVGGYAHLVGTHDIDNGKAMMVTNANVTVQNLEFSGASVGDMNGAGIRYESGNLTVLNSYFHDNQEGILAGSDDPNGHIVIRNSEFAHNGAGDGQSHGVYVGGVASLLVDGSDFHDTWYGNQLKSRAAETTVTNSHFSTGPDHANYDIDLPVGGIATIHGNTFEKGDTTDNPAIIHFGGEIDNAGGSLSVYDNQFASDLYNSTAVLNQSGVAVSVYDNVMSGIVNMLIGEGSLVGNVVGSVSISDPDTGAAPVDVGGSTPATEAPAPVDAGGTDTPPVDVGSDTPPIDDGGTDVAGDPPVETAPEPDPAPQWSGSWGWGWWHQPDPVQITGVGLHWWQDHQV